ncbi:MAG: SpoIIE family protein phosphatase [Gemmatimonadota bacterium]|nr:MAG: SpoIIE family protein phosphatase [Gemmatimonadota bacterium]
MMYIIFFLTVLFSVNLNAQHIDVQFKHLSIEHGLSQSNVQAILQDTRGFMWFGTEDGLNRYDGYNFVEYRHDSNDPKSLSHNFVRALHEDREGILWIGTENGLNRFDREQEIFKRYQHDPDDPHSLSHGRVMAMFEDHLGILWIGSEGGGLNRLVRSDTSVTFIHYQNDPHDPTTLSSDQVFTIYEDREGTLWVGTFGGLDKFDRETGKYTHYRHDPNDPHSLSEDNVWSILEDQLGFLWVGTFIGGLNRLDRETGRFTRYQFDPDDPYSLESNQIWTMYEDRKGALWLGTLGGGLHLYDRDADRFVSYQYDRNNPHSLSTYEVASIYEDKSGLLWVGTFGGGLNTFDRRKKPFFLYQSNPDYPKSLSSPFVSSFCEDHNGTLWIGTYGGGLNRFHPEDRTFTHYQHEPHNPFSLSHNSVATLFEDSYGELWIGTQGGGLNRFEGGTGRFTHYRNDPEDPYSLSSDFVGSMSEDKSGLLWIGTGNRGLNAFDRRTERFTRYQSDPDDPHSLSDNTIQSVYIDRRGDLWVGASLWSGLNKLALSETGESHGETKTFIRYQFDPADPHSLSHNLVLSMYEDNSGILWFGTEGGLNKLDRDRETFTHYREKDGLPSDFVHGILEDNHGNLWLSTMKGLSKFNPKTETFKNYNVTDGLQDNEFFVGACYKSKSGEMFFGGRNGFNVFFPDSIKDNPYIPPVVITDFQIFNETVSHGENSPLRKTITETREIELSHRENHISFQFAALDFTSPEENEYIYMLEGFEEDWVYSGNRRYVNYSNLPAGEYIFRVKGSNSDGVWNEEGTFLRITIRPPWWRTLWAYSIYFLVVFTIFYGIVRFEKKREREKARMREVELRALAAEAEARAIQVENERKTHELEEARRLQLSMLPKEMPQLPNIDIAVYMKTASEVGGDYYDFHQAKDGTLTVAIGDATGHGMKAGNMVVSMKSLFKALPYEMEVSDFFNRSTDILKKMHMEQLYMCMAVLRIKENQMSLTTAGMPPILVYRKETQIIEEMETGGIPLGWIEGFSYEQKETHIKTGDTILLMSDGYAELFNEREEMLDYPRIKQVFKEVVDNSPKDIITHLVDAGERWRGSRPQEDDITFVVLKLKDYEKEKEICSNNL